MVTSRFFDILLKKMTYYDATKYNSLCIMPPSLLIIYFILCSQKIESFINIIHYYNYNYTKY